MSAPVALIVTPRYLPMLGGMERECRLLAGELLERGYRPIVITEQLGEPLPRREVEDGIEVIRIRSDPTRSLAVQLRVAAALATLLVRYRRASFAIVRTTTLPALVVGLLKRLRMVRFPTLVTAETGGDNDDVAALARRPLFAASRWFVAGNDRLNGLCQANIDHLREHGFPELKITMVPNGIDVSAWERTGPPESVRTFLFLGRIEEAKGTMELAEALVAVRSSQPDVDLIVAGDGPGSEALSARCAALGLDGDAVHFLGRVPHERLGELFAQADALVLPSYSEGMPLSVLEAAAHHRVIVATDVGDLRRMFGDRVHLCPPRDAVALTEVMLAAVEAPPTADYAAVIEKVSIAAVVDELLALVGAQPRRSAT